MFCMLARQPLNHLSAEEEPAVSEPRRWPPGTIPAGSRREKLWPCVTDNPSGATDYCLTDIRGVVASAAPPTPASRRRTTTHSVSSREHGASLFFQAKPALRATRLDGRPVFIRELLPQDLKIEIDYLTTKQATKAARFLA